MRRIPRFESIVEKISTVFFVYVLLSLRDGKFYIGHTNRLDDRIKRHNEGRVPATRHRRPLTLVYSEKYTTRAEAVHRERFLKSLMGNQMFRDIIGV